MASQQGADHSKLNEMVVLDLLENAKHDLNRAWVEPRALLVLLKKNDVECKLDEVQAILDELFRKKFVNCVAEVEPYETESPVYHILPEGTEHLTQLRQRLLEESA